MSNKNIGIALAVAVVLSVSAGGLLFLNASGPTQVDENPAENSVQSAPEWLNETYQDDWAMAESASDYQQILSEAGRFEHDPSSWHSPPNVSIGGGFGIETADYVVFKGSEDNYYAKNGDNGSISFEHSDFSTLMNNILDNNLTIFIRAGDYFVNSPIDLTDISHVKIVGSGWDTNLHNDNNTDIFYAAPSNMSHINWFRDFEVRGHKDTQSSGNGIYVSETNGGEAKDWDIKRVLFQNMPETAVWTADFWGWKLIGMLAERCGGNGIHIDGGQGGEITACRIAMNDEYGIDMVGPARIQIYGNEIESNTKGIYATGAAMALEIVGNEFKGNTDQSIRNKGDGWTIVGNTFYDTAEIDLYGDDVTITGNTFDLQNNYNYAIIPRRDDTRIYGNTFKNIITSIITDSGTRTILDGRYYTPPTENMGGTDGVISPVKTDINTYDLRVDAGGSTVNLQGIDTINESGITINQPIRVTLSRTGGENVTLVDDAAVTYPLKNQSDGNLTMDDNGETITYLYDSQNEVWRELWHNFE